MCVCVCVCVCNLSRLTSMFFLRGISLPLKKKKDGVLDMTLNK